MRTRHPLKLNIDNPPSPSLYDFTSCSSVTSSPPLELGVGVCSPDILQTGSGSQSRKRLGSESGKSWGRNLLSGAVEV